MNKYLAYLASLSFFLATSAAASPSGALCEDLQADVGEEAEKSCREFGLHPQFRNEAVTNQARSRCLSFFMRAVEAKMLICQYQADAASTGTSAGEAREKKRQYWAQLKTKFQELVAERDIYFSAINKVGALSGRVFLEEARGESARYFSSQVPSPYLAGLARKALGDLQTTSRALIPAIRWTAAHARGDKPDIDGLKKLIAQQPPLGSEEEPSPEPQAGSHEHEHPAAKGAKHYVLDKVASLLGEKPVERLLEGAAESEIAHAFPTLSGHASRVLPTAAGVAIVLAYEGLVHREVRLSTLAVVGASVVGGTVVGVAAAGLEAAYLNQQEKLARYRSFAGTYLQKQPDASSHQLSQAFLSAPAREEHVSE